ncbi:MAG: FtsQ-type POTRA domain-containing protein [Treponema sp.]|nr:FtsQ-type POTRA domain-containing protein [Treponema sp.]MCL2272115.1 FtsQ-type POTRA domain-containing protein [Treponema sp.]
MASDYMYTASDDFPVKSKSSGGFESTIKKLVIFTAVIFAAQMIWLFGVTPFVPFSTIEIQTFAGLQRSEVLLTAGLDDGSSFFSTSAADVKNKIESNLLVESAAVIKRFPDKLSIYLYPRRPAAVALANFGSQQVPILIDRYGVFFRYGDPQTHGMTEYPVISGFENPQLNMRLPATLVSLPESLSLIASSSPQLLSAISEIRIEQKAWEGYDLVLFPVHSSIKVRLENNLTEDVLRYMLLMLNVFKDNEQRPEEIDFRSGIGSYRVKEQS